MREFGKLVSGSVLVLACILASCSGAPAPDNLLENPGFEDGRHGWRAMSGSRYWGDFRIVDTVAGPVRSGRRAAHLPVRWEPHLREHAVRVFGVLQQPSPEQFPAMLSGWYRFETWSKDAPETDLYAQVVVVVWGDPRAPEIVSPQAPDPRVENYQIRYYLAGIHEPPFTLSNARVKFLGKGPPRLGEWIYFEIPLRDDFRELWGTVPEDYAFVRVLFEGRWDNKPEGTRVRADVYFDDLFLGAR